VIKHLLVEILVPVGAVPWCPKCEGRINIITLGEILKYNPGNSGLVFPHLA
jgi:hypothetical protein